MESFINDLNKIMSDITKLFKEFNIHFIFIGGAARNQYNAFKTTEDIDLLVSSSDRDKISKLPIGFIRDISGGRNKVLSWADPKTRIELIYSGEISGDGIRGLKYPEPDNIEYTKNGIPVMKLNSLIEFKLSSGIYGDREKDFADVRDLIRKNNLSKDYGNNFRSDLKIKYIELWDKEHNINNIDKEFNKY